MPKMTRTPRATRPVRRFGTIQARGHTFAQVTQHAGTKLVRPEAAGPLGPNAPAKYTTGFDTLAQGWEARALREPAIAHRVRQTHASGAELVVAGFFLAHGYVEGRDLFFQEAKFIINDRSRARTLKEFVVDNMINSRWGTNIYMNIDGVYYHDRTQLEAFKDAVRDGRLRAKGRVIDIPDTVCFSGEDLRAFLLREALP